MPYERTGYAPWSLTREAGVESATVDGTIQVPQYVYPNLDTGFIDEKGVWQGRKSDDRSFIGITKGEGIANGGEMLAPDTPSFPSINMSGFRDIFIALKPSSGGGFAVKAVMGPDTVPFANLTPVNAATDLKGAVRQTDFNNLLADGADSMTADVWNIFYIQNSLVGQQNLQFKITNNTGGSSDIEFAFMRLV
jgi:hypothetical protein